MLIRFDVQFKKLFTTLNIDSFDLILFLLTCLGQIDTATDNLILVNLSNFLKEIDICKKYSQNDMELSVYLTLVTYFRNTNYNLYSIKSPGTDFITLNLCLGMFSSLFSNSLPNTLDIKLTYQLFNYLFELALSICSDVPIKNKIKSNKKINNSQIDLIKSYEPLILNIIISFIHTVYISKNIDVDFLFFINKFFVQNCEIIFNFIFQNIKPKLGFDFILIKTLIIFYFELLNNLYYTKIDLLPENVHNFVKSYQIFLKKIFQMEEFLKHTMMNNFYFIEKSVDAIKMLEEKFTIGSSIILDNKDEKIEEKKQAEE